MKLLIIRLSSFGDIVQCMSILEPLGNSYDDLEIHWICRSDFTGILKLSPLINKVWSFDRVLGIIGLITLSFNLRNEGFTHIYDAHSTIRSRIISFILNPFNLGQLKFKRRSKDRIKRILLFKFRVNHFEKPFLGMKSFVTPIMSWIKDSENRLSISKWNFDNIDIHKKLPSKYIALAPSAAWSMKTWPKENFKELITRLPQYQFVILGGPADHFCQEFEMDSPANVINMAGKLNLAQSCSIIQKADFIVSADTGLIHVADLLGIKGASLIGPTAFGHCSGEHIKTFETPLPCRPCTKDGRGKCGQDIYQECMVKITPLEISKYIEEVL